MADLFGDGRPHICTEARWVRFTMVSGQFHYAYWCPECGNITQQEFGTRGIWAKKALAAEKSGRDPDTFEVIDPNYVRLKCSHCDDTSAESHHIAPAGLFEDADAWPQVALCPKCHRLWHEIVTPSLIRPYNPDRHVKVMAQHLSYQQLDQLRVAIVEFLALEMP